MMRESVVSPAAFGGLDFKRALSIDGAGIDGIAGALFDGHGFTGDRGLIDGRSPCKNSSVERNLLPRFD